MNDRREVPLSKEEHGAGRHQAYGLGCGREVFRLKESSLATEGLFKSHQTAPQAEMVKNKWQMVLHSVRHLQIPLCPQHNRNISPVETKRLFWRFPSVLLWGWPRKWTQVSSGHSLPGLYRGNRGKKVSSEMQTLLNRYANLQVSVLDLISRDAEVSFPLQRQVSSSV